MSNSSDIPVIPRRPQRPITSDNKNEEAFTRTENVVGNKQPSVPNVPRRPGQHIEISNTVPIIPERPRAYNSIPKELGMQRDSTGNLINESPEKDNDSKQTISQKTSIDLNKSLVSEESSKLNVELDEKVSDESDADGEKTPGNSKNKITFKDSSESPDPLTNVSDSFEFNDDLETISQKEDDQWEGNQSLADRDIENDIDQTPDLKDNYTEKFLEIDDYLDIPEENKANYSIQKDEITKNINPKIGESILNTTENVEKISQISLPLRENDTDFSEKLSARTETEMVPDNVSKIDEDVKEISVPKIPSEPMKTRNNSGTNTVTGTDGMDSSINSGKNENLLQADQNNLMDTVVPKIPSRPLKLKTENTYTNIKDDIISNNFNSPANSESNKDEKVLSPIIPSRPIKKLSSSSDNATTKSKAPPIKPKKLSTKMAAFQEMFTQDESSDRDSKPLQKPKNNNWGPAKLSSDKQKFADSLKGVMGNVIPLPGLTTSHMKPFQPMPEKISGSSVTEKAQESSKPKRAKGPRGKRLPQSLKDPVIIESDLKYSIVVSKQWEVNIEKKGKKGSEETKPSNKSSSNSPESKVESGLDSCSSVEEKPNESDAELISVKKTPENTESTKSTSDEVFFNAGVPENEVISEEKDHSLSNTEQNQLESNAVAELYDTKGNQKN